MIALSHRPGGSIFGLVLIAGFTAGLGFAYAARGSVGRTQSALRSPPVVVASVFAVLVLLPALLGFYFTRPGWTLMYLAHPEHLPVGLATIGLGVMAMGSSPTACLLGIVALTKADAKAFSRLLLGCVGTLGLWLVAGWGRITTIVPYETFHAHLDDASPLSGPLGPVVGLVVAIALAAYAICFAQLRGFAAQIRRSQA